MNRNPGTGTTVLLLTLLPGLLCVAGMLYITHIGPFFLKSVDPEYAYLFNGMLLANFKPGVQFVYHPGTLAQLAIALVIKVTHLFRPGMPLMDDVLLNPEFYISTVLFTFTVINVLSVFILGYYTLRFTGSILTALLLQLTPFTHILTLEVTARMMPESLMTAIVCLWLVLLVKILYQHEKERDYARYAFLFGILFGIGLADKLTFLPYFLLPLIVLPARKYRIKYALFALLFFLIFAFPVVLNYRNFYHWVTNLFIHTGAYGSGDTGIFKWNELMDHLMLQFQNTWLLWTTLVVMLLLTIAVVLKTKEKRPFRHLRFRMVTALFFVITLALMMGAKHFAYHYMIPAILLTAFLVHLIVLQAKELFAGRFTNLLTGIIPLGFGILLVIMILPKTGNQLKQIKNNTESKIAAYNRVAPFLKGNVNIIAPSYYGCPSVTYALTFGLHESGKYGDMLFEKIRKLYDYGFMYYTWGNVFYMGNKEIKPSVFIKPGGTYTVYMAEYSEEKLNRLLAAIEKDGIGSSGELTKLFQSQETGEAVFSLHVANE